MWKYYLLEKKRKLGRELLPLHVAKANDELTSEIRFPHMILRLGNTRFFL